MAVAAVWQAGGEGKWGGVRCSSGRSWRRKANDGGWREERQARGGGLRGGGAAAKAVPSILWPRCFEQQEGGDGVANALGPLGGRDVLLAVRC